MYALPTAQSSLPPPRLAGSSALSAQRSQPGGNVSVTPSPSPPPRFAGRTGRAPPHLVGRSAPTAKRSQPGGDVALGRATRVGPPRLAGRTGRGLGRQRGAHQQPTAAAQDNVLGDLSYA